MLEMVEWLRNNIEFTEKLYLVTIAVFTFLAARLYRGLRIVRTTKHVLSRESIINILLAIVVALVWGFLTGSLASSPNANLVATVITCTVAFPLMTIVGFLYIAWLNNFQERLNANKNEKSDSK